MKRILFWMFMIVVFTAAIVGGTIGYFYFKAGPSAMPESEVRLEDLSVGDPIGYDWSIPVFFGSYQREFSQSPSLTVNKIGSVTAGHPALNLPSWVTKGELSIKNDSGKEVFSGSLTDYESYAFTGNGRYTVTLKLYHSVANERPAAPQGWYQYCFRFDLDAQPTVSFSKTEISQGSVLGIKVTGILGSSGPAASCDLGSVWFSQSGDTWYGYLPVAFNADAGTHSLTVTSGSHTVTQDIEVYQKDFARVQVSKDNEDEEKAVPDGASAEYRNKIWPLYSEGSLAKQWLGGFSQPVKGTTKQDYGVYLIGDGTTTRSSDLTLKVSAGEPVIMPTDGVISFAGDLLLCGKTVVIDHGCGLKTYISGLGDIYVSKGQSLLQGEEVGLTGDDDIIIEMRIGNKSINPWDAWRGNGGLFYK